jgi:hypothetical protein
MLIYYKTIVILIQIIDRKSSSMQGQLVPNECMPAGFPGI